MHVLSQSISGESGERGSPVPRTEEVATAERQMLEDCDFSHGSMQWVIEHPYHAAILLTRGLETETKYWSPDYLNY